MDYFNKNHTLMSLSQIIYKSKPLSWLYCKLSQLRAPGFKSEVERRAKLDLFDYKEIAQPLPKCYYELLTDNNCFGIGWCIRHYIGSGKDYLDAMVEHGYFFGVYVSELEKATYAKKIFTFGDVRRNHIKAVIPEKEIYQIGPYIHYAPDYYDENKFSEVKKRLGRTLLVFFSHSGTGQSVNFDLDALIESINSVRGRFKTVVISLFWSDINPQIESRLLKEGYLIFSSGHRYDYYFLSRQKTMIKLADVTMSNSPGTHIAYCTYLNKPHWLIRQEINYNSLNSTGIANTAIIEQQSKDVVNLKEKEELYKAFSQYLEDLTEEQKKLCNYYFGFSYIKSVNEMKSVLG